MFKNKKLSAFTMSELLVVVLIVAVISTIAAISFSNTRRAAEDKKIVAKVIEMQSALESYRMIEGEYPENDRVVAGDRLMNDNLNTFHEEIPSDIYYNKIEDQDSYEISFYLEGPHDSLTAGYKCAVPGSLLNEACTGGAIFLGDAGIFTDERDGQVYNWVKIDGKIWMAENLNYGNMLCSADPGADRCDENASDDGLGNIEKYCYDNLETNCDAHGAFYDWDEAMDYSTASGVQGICPDGWHIPSKTEIESLVSFVGANSGNKLKAISPDWNGSDVYGFKILPTGTHRSYGPFDGISNIAYIWSSTLNGSGYSWRLELSSGIDLVNWLYTSVDNTSSLRCLKDL
jgi:uncharacterized protein (TIGR02145 family)